MSLIYFPGEPLSGFFDDPVMEVQPRGTKEHGVPSRPNDGRVYLNDQRPDSPWRSRHNESGRWVCCYARPTARLDAFMQETHGSWRDGSLEVVPWHPSARFPAGAVVLIAHPGGDMRFISRYMVALEVPDYAGFKTGDAVSALWWDGKYYPAEVVGAEAGGPEYRLRFPHAVGHGRYVSVKPEAIRPRGTDEPAPPGRQDGDPPGHPV